MRPQARMRRYVYAVLDAMMDPENEEQMRWFYEGVDPTEHARLKKAINAVSDETRRKAAK